MNLKLTATDCAIVIDKNAKISYFLPTTFGPKDNASDGILMATCIAIFLHDDDMLHKTREILHEKIGDEQ